MNYFMSFLGPSGHWPENKWKNSPTFKSIPWGVELWGRQFYRNEKLSGAKMPKNDLKMITMIKNWWKRAFLQNFKKTLPAKPTHSPFSAAWIAENLGNLSHLGQTQKNSKYQKCNSNILLNFFLGLSQFTPKIDHLAESSVISQESHLKLCWTIETPIFTTFAVRISTPQIAFSIPKKHT